MNLAFFGGSEVKDLAVLSTWFLSVLVPVVVAILLARVVGQLRDLNRKMDRLTEVIGRRNGPLS